MKQVKLVGEPKSRIVQKHRFFAPESLRMNFVYIGSDIKPLYSDATRIVFRGGKMLYSGFRYTIQLPLQPYQIQLYTFGVQVLAFSLPLYPD